MNLSNPFKIIQLTDLHLFKDNSLLFNIKPNASFLRIINYLQEDLSDTDGIFLTGDLSQDESEESYHFLAKQFKNFEKPIYWIPGNHDSIERMHFVFSQYPNFKQLRKLSTEFWDFVFLNTQIWGTNEGFLTDYELQELTKELKLSGSKPVVIVMHHHPIEVGTPLIDQYILKNISDFWDCLKSSEVKLIICGHVHGDYSLIHNNIHLEASPATCVQWMKGTSELKFDYRIGYKIYYFSKNSFLTKTEWDCEI